MVVGERLARYGFGDGHPFGPDRHAAFVREFEARGLDERVQRARAARRDRRGAALLPHARATSIFVRERSASGQGLLDGGDTPAFRGVYEAAACVVGATLNAADAIMRGDVPPRLRADRAACITPRATMPPGSACSTIAAWRSSCCGSDAGLERIAYVDIDAHHGDGVFYAFEDDAA